MSKTIITAKIRPDGTVVEVLEDGEERPFPEIRRIPRAKSLRRALNLIK